MTVAEALALVESKAACRTVYPGQPEQVDEVLAAEVERLTAVIARCGICRAHVAGMLTDQHERDVFAENERLTAIVEELRRLCCSACLDGASRDQYGLHPNGDLCDAWTDTEAAEAKGEARA